MMTDNERRVPESLDAERLLQPIRASLSGQPLWPGRFARLARAIQEAGPVPEDQADHEGVQELLDIVVGDQLDGFEPADRYPVIWAHLQECALCRAEYESLYDLLRRERAGDLIALPHSIRPPHFAFLAPVESPTLSRSEEGIDVAPWTLHISRRLGEVNAYLAFTREYLESIFRPFSPIPAERLDDQYFGEFLLYSAMLDELDGAVLEVTANPKLDHPGSFEIHLSLAAPDGPIRAAAVNLTWAGRTFYGTTDAHGRATFTVAPGPGADATVSGPEPTYGIQLSIAQAAP